MRRAECSGAYFSPFLLSSTPHNTNSSNRKSWRWCQPSLLWRVRLRESRLPSASTAAVAACGVVEQMPETSTSLLTVLAHGSSPLPRGELKTLSCCYMLRQETPSWRNLGRCIFALLVSAAAHLTRLLAQAPHGCFQPHFSYAASLLKNAIIVANNSEISSSLGTKHHRNWTPRQLEGTKLHLDPPLRLVVCMQ